MRRVIAAIGLLLFMLASDAEAGMRLTLVMVPPDQVARLGRDEKALSELLLGAEAASRSGTKRDTVLVMDKEWHGIHFLLNGDRWSTSGPYGQVILGGTAIGPDLGFGPARVLDARQVGAIASRLGTLPIDQLQRRYDPAAMTAARIYLDVWEREGAGALEWLLAGYRSLVDFYARAAAQGQAVVLAVL